VISKIVFFLYLKKMVIYCHWTCRRAKPHYHNNRQGHLQIFITKHIWFIWNWTRGPRGLWHSPGSHKSIGLCGLFFF